MRSSIRRTAIFRLEQLVSRGAHYRFLVVLGVIGLMSVVGGLAVLMVGDAELSNPADATWWAFLRLSDTGYLGDDEGFVSERSPACSPCSAASCSWARWSPS